MDSTHEEPESRAAETLGMDSIDEEPESFDVSETDEQPKLPSAVQYLIRRLEGKGEPFLWFPDLSEPEFREFFPDGELISTITGWRSQVRLRVLEAIGNCNTFEYLQVGVICGGDISRLTASEWEIVCRGFMSSTVLKEISLSQLRWGSDEEVESFCLQLGGILNSSSVTDLTICGCELSARCWLNLASGLRGHFDSKLQTLDLGDAWEDSSAVKHVAEMINSAPLLQKLILRESSKMDDEAVGMLSQALIQSLGHIDVGTIESKLGHILTSQQELQPTRVNKNYSLFRSEVDGLIQYFHSLQQAKTPKLPYLANDVGIFYSMSAKLHLGKTVRLHLMCESVDGFHMVKDQEGVMIRLDQENCAWIQKIVEITCKVMYYAVKAGLDKTLNLGQAIPDWEDLQSDIFKLEGISDPDRRAVRKGGKSMELNEAWLRIQQTLEPQLRGSYSAIFKLYQVKYVSQELDGHELYEHAWVCEECMHKGLNSRVLIV